MMLQVVLGLDAVRIASAFLVKPSAMGQRLSRAKTRIRVAGLRFELPGATDLPSRLDAVLEAIYAAYGSGWQKRPSIWVGCFCNSCRANRRFMACWR